MGRCRAVALLCSAVLWPWLLHSRNTFALPTAGVPRKAMTTLEQTLDAEISSEDENRLRVNAAMPSSNVVALSTPQDLAEVLDRVGRTGQLLVVDYYAPWCRACQKLLRFMHKLAKDIGQRWFSVKFLVSFLPFFPKNKT